MCDFLIILIVFFVMKIVSQSMRSDKKCGSYLLQSRLNHYDCNG